MPIYLHYTILILFTLHYFNSAVTIIFILLFTAESYISQWWGPG